MRACEGNLSFPLKNAAAKTHIRAFKVESICNFFLRFFFCVINIKCCIKTLHIYRHGH